MGVATTPVPRFPDLSPAATFRELKRKRRQSLEDGSREAWERNAEKRDKKARAERVAMLRDHLQGGLLGNGWANAHYATGATVLDGQW